MDDDLRRIEDQLEGAHYAGLPNAPRCERCGSTDLSDRQGHIRPDGDERPPWLMVCEDCGHEWEEEA